MPERNDIDAMPVDYDTASDIEVALYLIWLIEANPGIRIRGIIERANEALKKMSNPFAVKLLKDKVNQ